MTRRTGRLRVAHRVHTVLTVAVVLTLLVLNLTDALGSDMALRLFLLIELPLTLVFVVVTVLRCRNLGRSGAAGDGSLLDRLEAEEPLLRPAISEIRSMWGLCLVIAGRKRVPARATPFGYTKGTLVMPAVLLVLCMGELLVVHLVVPWQWLRLVLLVLTVWGTLFILGFFASRAVNPHFISAGALHLRWGHKKVLTTPLTNILSAQRHTNHTHVQPFAQGERMVLTQFRGANVRLRLEEPVEAHPPLSKKDAIAGFKASEVQLYVDDPDALLTALGALETRAGEVSDTTEGSAAHA